MLRQLREITLQMVAGANVATIAIMAFSGYSDRINPAEHGILAQAGLAFPLLLLANLGFLTFWLIFARRYALIPVAGYLLCCIPIRIYFPVNIPKAAPEGAIKVLTYNVLGYKPIDGSPLWPNSTLEYIAQSGADLVCLQESGAGYLSEGQINSVLRPVYEYTDSARAQGGECIRLYSKYPILGKEHIRYNSKSNVSAAFTVKIDADTVIVINNHLESNALSPKTKRRFKDMVKGEMNKGEMKKESKLLISRLAKIARRRAPEADAVARYVSKNSGKSIILCGDFNDSPISYTRRTIARDLTDCYVSTATGPGISYHFSGFYVRIDNIMCSDHWEPYGCRVDNKIKSSDHYPVYCWLKRKG